MSSLFSPSNSRNSRSASEKSPSSPSVTVEIATLPLTTPPAAHRSPIRSQNEMAIDFFDGRVSNNNRVPSGPPPYSSLEEPEALPAYTGNANDSDEPVTLARYMFIFGFFFPPFWFIGSLILFSRLRPTPEWELGKTEEEKAFILNRMRSTEVKWAKRCLAAFVVFIIMAVALTAGICTWAANAAESA